jgi:aminoglycoside phosphotransferase family enzyme
MLHRLIAGGAVGPAAMRALADVLVAFYRAAPALPQRGPDYAAQLARECAAHAAVLEHARVAAVAEGGGIAAAAADAIARLACALDRHAPALHARAEAGRIVEGHGDLRPEHVCFPRVNATAAAASATAAPSAAAAAPVIIDALEFNAELRRVDPLDELAYLGLECEAAGARWIGPWLAREYAAALEPEGVPPLLPPLYAAHRAMLRARLCAAHLLDDPPPPAPQAAQWLTRSRRYLELAQRALRSLQAIEAEAGTT